MQKWPKGVPLYFVGVIVIALAVILHAVVDQSSSNVPFAVGALGLVLAAGGQAAKDNEDRANRNCNGSCSLPSCVVIPGSVTASEVREALNALEARAGFTRRTKKLVLGTMIINHSRYSCTPVVVSGDGA